MRELLKLCRENACKQDGVIKYKYKNKEDRGMKNAKDANNNTINMDNSSSYGNYSGNTDNKTGTRSNCKTNNIFDLAGNYWKWTQEAKDTSNRTIRGR